MPRRCWACGCSTCIVSVNPRDEAIRGAPGLSIFPVKRPWHSKVQSTTQDHKGYKSSGCETHFYVTAVVLFLYTRRPTKSPHQTTSFLLRIEILHICYLQHPAQRYTVDAPQLTLKGRQALSEFHPLDDAGGPTSTSLKDDLLPVDGPSVEDHRLTGRPTSRPYSCELSLICWHTWSPPPPFRPLNCTSAALLL